MPPKQVTMNMHVGAYEKLGDQALHKKDVDPLEMRSPFWWPNFKPKSPLVQFTSGPKSLKGPIHGLNKTLFH